MELPFRKMFGRPQGKETAAQAASKAGKPKKRVLLTIAGSDKKDTAPRTRRDSFVGSVRSSFRSLTKGPQRMRNMLVLAAVVLVAMTAVFLGAESGLFGASFNSTPTYERKSTLKVVPDVGTFTVGDTFDANIMLNTQGQETVGVDLSMSYDPDSLDVIDNDTTYDGIQIQPGTLYPQYSSNLADPLADPVNKVGKISLIAFNPPGQTFSNTTDQLFATIHFKAKKATNSSELKFIYDTNPQNISSTDSNVVMRLTSESTGDVLGSVTNAVYTINGAGEELFVTITTNDGKDFDSDQATRTIKGSTSPATDHIEVNGKPLQAYQAGDQKWSATRDLDTGSNKITVKAFNADGTKSADAKITITYNPPAVELPTTIPTPVPTLSKVDQCLLDHSFDPTKSTDRTGDLDGDGLTNEGECATGTDPTKADTDGDGMPDGWEQSHNLNPLDPSDKLLDPDNDACTNFDEYVRSADPHNPDTDGDGLKDCEDSNPLVAQLHSAPTPAASQPSTSVPAKQITQDGPGTLINIALLLAAVAATSMVVLQKRHREKNTKR